MPHNIIIIDEKASCTTSKVNQLKNLCHDLDAVYEQFDKPQSEAAHEALHRAQELLTAMCEGTPLGSMTLDGIITEVNGFLEA